MKIAIGSAQFGFDYGITNLVGKVPLPEVQRIIGYSRDQLIDTIDTAISYGGSECNLGKCGVSDFKVITKLPKVPNYCDSVSEWVEEQVMGSLDRLRMDRLYGVLLHDSGQVSEKYGRQIVAQLEKLKFDGIIQKIGLSIYDPAELDRSSESIEWDIVQSPLNIFDKRLISSGWLKKLQSQGSEVHIRSIFLQGLLLSEHDFLIKRFGRWNSVWDGWRRWLENMGLTPLEACVNFATSVDGVDRVIVGVESELQLRDILTSVGKCANYEYPPIFENLSLDLINPVRWNSV